MTETTETGAREAQDETSRSVGRELTRHEVLDVLAEAGVPFTPENELNEDVEQAFEAGAELAIDEAITRPELDRAAGPFKATVLRATLKAALGLVSQVVPKQPMVEGWASVRLRTVGDTTIALTVANVEVEAMLWVPAPVFGAGEIQLPLADLQALVAKGKGTEALTFTASEDGKTVTVSSEAGVSLTIAVPESKPIQHERPVVVAGRQVELDALLVAALVGQTAWATSTKESRRALMGVLVERTADEVALVGCDGHRLARASSPRPRAEADEAFSLLVPPLALATAARLAGTEPTLSIAQARWVTGAEGVVIEGRWGRVTARVIDETYPAYQTIIPTTERTSVTVDVAALRAAAEQVAGAADKETGRMVLDVPEGACHVTTDDGVTSEGELVLRCENGKRAMVARVPVQLRGPAIRIGFDVRYLIQTLKAIGDRVRVTLGITEQERPVSVTPVGDLLPVAVTHVIMPLKLIDPTEPVPVKVADAEPADATESGEEQPDEIDADAIAAQDAAENEPA